MTSITPIITNFSGGELSPYMDGRTDLSSYFHSAREAENFLFLPQGPAERRGGTRFIGETKTSVKKARLVPFEFSTEQAYMIEAGDGYFRFYMNGGIIESSPGVPYEVTTPYLEADLAKLKWCQSADVLYLAHPNHAPRKLSRTGHTSWTLTTISFTAAPAAWGGSNQPSCCTFYEERLWWGHTPDKPQTLWASKTGDYENHSVSSPLKDDDALTFTIADDRVNAIRWLSAGKVLTIGTTGGVFTAQASSLNEGITPANITIRRELTAGVADVAPVRVGHSVLYPLRAGRKVFQVAYAFSSDSWQGADLTVLAEQATRSGLTEMAYQEEPYPVVWCCRADGQLVGCTYLPEQKVTAWHRHRLGGEGLAESIAVIPGATGDEVWLLVRRTIGGQTRRYIEVLTEPLALDGAQVDAFFVDCGLTYQGAAASTVTGLEHLEGVTVQILADGGVHPERVVAGGAIALEWAAATVHVGFGSVARLQPMQLEPAAGTSTAQGKIKRISKVKIRLARSLGGKVGRDADNLEDILFRDPTMAMDSPPPLFSGDKTVTFPGDFDTAGGVLMIQDQPLPFTVNALIPYVVIADA